MLKKSLFILLIITMAMIFLLPLSGLLLHHGLYTIPHFVHHHAFWLTLWRYSFYVLTIIFWSSIVQWMGKRRGWSSELTQRLAGLRWQLIGFFIVVELFFVHNLVGQLLSWL